MFWTKNHENLASTDEMRFITEKKSEVKCHKNSIENQTKDRTHRRPITIKVLAAAHSDTFEFFPNFLPYFLFSRNS